MTTQEADYMREIVNHPDDDGPRLRYANWLQPDDPARAALIRYQCEHSRILQQDPFGILSGSLTNAIHALLKHHAQRWLGPLEVYTELGIEFLWHRGMIEGVACSVSDFNRIIRDLLNEPSLPLVRRWNLLRSSHVEEPDLDNIDHSSLARIRYIRVSPGGCTDRLLQALLASASVSHLNTFDSGDAGEASKEEVESYCGLISSHAVTSLFGQATSLSLVKLLLPSHRIGPQGFRTLIDSAKMPMLSVLDVQDNDINGFDLADTSIRPDAVRLSSLNLSNNNIGLPGASFITNVGLLDSASSVNMYRTSLGSEGFRQILPLKSSKLTSLMVGGNSINDDDLSELCDQISSRQLKRLDIRSSSVSDRGAARLSATPALVTLESLNLSHNNISDAGVFNLAESVYLKNLRHLHIGSNSVGPEGVICFVDSPVASNLESLDLFGCSLDSRCIDAMCRSPFLEKLMFLHVSGLPEELITRLQGRFGGSVVFR